MNDQERYERAKEKVEELKGFYIHLVAYLIVNVFLVGGNLMDGNINWGLLAVPFFWGIGLAAHAIDVYGLGVGWEERKIREFMERDGTRKSKDEYFEEM
jgi:hypothetical protein